MLVNILLAVLNFFWYGLFELFFFTNLPGISVDDFGNALELITPFLKLFDNFFPVNYLFVLLTGLAAGIIFMVVFKAARFVISIFKGGIK